MSKRTAAQQLEYVRYSKNKIIRRLRKELAAKQDVINELGCQVAVLKDKIHLLYDGDYQRPNTWAKAAEQLVRHVSIYGSSLGRKNDSTMTDNTT